MATILVVDDRAVNREFLVTLLGYRGHRVLEAGDGAEALEVLRTTRADLVISDILMPTMDGYELVRRMRLSEATASLPVMLFTAHYNELEARNLAKSCGVARVLTKPSSPEQVLATVDELLANEPPLPAVLSERFDEEHLLVLNNKLVEFTDELRRQRSHLAALLDMNLQLASERDPQKLLEGFCRAARDLVAARYVIVGIDDPGRGPLQHVFISGMAEGPATELETALRQNGAFADVDAVRRSIKHWLDDRDSKAAGLLLDYSLVVAPIRSLANVYGWVCATDKIGVDSFSEEDEPLLGMFAAQVGRIYENGSLYADATKRADDLRLEIRERQLAVTALRESEENFRYLFLNLPLPMWVYDTANLRFLEVNDVAIARYGYSREEFLAMTLADISPPEDVERLLERPLLAEVDHAHETGWRHRGQDGRFMDVEVYGHDIRYGNESARLALVVDVTERRETERQLLQAQKMEAVGQLTGGVAHDFNNILTVIMANVDALEEDEKFSPNALGRISEIGGAAQRAADLTRQLLAFSRKQSLRPQRTNINDLVTVTGNLLRRTLGERIEIEAVLVDDLWTANVDRGQLETALVNLCINARDAIPKGGKLLIETKNVALDLNDVAYGAGVVAGDYAMLAVTDSGKGIPDDELHKVFEPFFTTKEVGKGTGLGLSMVYGFIKQSSGHIQIYSEIGHGTTVKMYLPRVHGKGEEPVARPTAAIPRGTERILVVEDNSSVRIHVVEQLHSLGYSVAEAVNGADALDHLKTAGETYDLVLTDMVMPGALDGKALADQVALRWPGTPVILMSGYTENAVVQQGRLPPGMHLLTKPFRKADLAKAVRAMLTSAIAQPLVPA